MSGALLPAASKCSPVTIVMYHYVRPIAGSRHPRIRGLELHDFEGQLDHIERHYRVISAAQLVNAARTGSPLPDNPLLLTFDDGYADHHQYVTPALQRRGMSGLFFPTSGTVEERWMLDVNKLHFVLATVGDFGALVRIVESAVEASRSEFDMPPLADFRARLWAANRFDPPEVIYVKRMLQFALPEILRNRITSDLFHQYVSRDEAAFADELYVSVDQLRRMREGGMEIGSHGHAHYWLDSLPVADQARDIDRSLQMLDRIGVTRQGFYFCYPFGGYTSDTVALLADRGCGAAFTTRVALARPETNDMLVLPRLDTNDLPRRGDAAPRPGLLRRTRAATSPLTNFNDQQS
jgi:peptidoglycan/xylan/chitin deacetylase (PgdA/CDA1 family)